MLQRSWKSELSSTEGNRFLTSSQAAMTNPASQRVIHRSVVGVQPLLSRWERECQANAHHCFILLHTHTELKQKQAFKVSGDSGKSARPPLSAHQTVKLAQLVDSDEMRRGQLRTHTVLLPNREPSRNDELHTDVIVTWRPATPWWFNVLLLCWWGGVKVVITTSASEGSSGVFGSLWHKLSVLTTWNNLNMWRDRCLRLLFSR